jgi:glucosamine--fructose-6-phosphate aminotransferase (isomerizing)
MCGIVGAIGSREDLYKNVSAGLRCLEYRGYDSYGFASVINDQWLVKKGVGAISQSIADADLVGFKNAKCMIAHTRWATHGGVTVENAHPHFSSDQSVAIVHNGVITNFHDLKRKACSSGVKFHSDTDTEVCANELARLFESNGDIVSVIAEAFSVLDGEFAVVGMLKSHEDKLFGFKRKSPLIVGLVNDYVVLVSDENALGKFGSEVEVCYLEDNEFVVCSLNECSFYSVKGNQVERISKVFIKKNISIADDGLEGYPHYMLKEINESPRAVESVRDSIKKVLPAIAQDIKDKQLSLVGSGSSFYAAQIGQYFFSKLCGLYVATHTSDEMLNLKKFSSNDCLICLSQSGETFDVLEVVREAQKCKATVVAINNVLGSTCQRIADYSVFQDSGKEVCVLSTKSVISQVVSLFILASKIAEDRGLLSAEDVGSLKSELSILPMALSDLIKRLSDDISKVSYLNCNIEHWFFIGRGVYYPIAMESALKFKEVSYLHAEGMAAGFLKHGTISLIDEGFYTVAFLPSKVFEKDLFDNTVDNIHEIKARGGKVIGIGNARHADFIDDFFISYIELPDIGQYLNACLQLCAGQLLAYYCAIALGRNVDRPRALAKSVTVR